MGDAGYEVKKGDRCWRSGHPCSATMQQRNSVVGYCCTCKAGRGVSWGSPRGEGAEAAGDLQVQGQWHGGRTQHQLEMSHHLMSAGRLSITWSAPGRTSSN